MAKTHPPYAPEFRRQMVELVRAGRGPEELAREFELRRRRFATGSSKPGVTMTVVATRALTKALSV